MYHDTDIAAAMQIVISEINRVHSKLDIYTAQRIAMRALGEGRIEALDIDSRIEHEIDAAMRIVNSETTCVQSKINIETAMRIAMRARCEGRIEALLDAPDAGSPDSSFLPRESRTGACTSRRLSMSLPPEA